MVAPIRLLGPGLLTLALGACAAPQTALKTIPPTGQVGGAPEKTILESLGEPQFKRKDPPAEIWQYTTRDCVLLLFLYPDQGGTVVRHSVAQSRKGQNFPAGDCVERVIAARAKPGTPAAQTLPTQTLPTQILPAQTPAASSASTPTITPPASAPVSN